MTITPAGTRVIEFDGRQQFARPVGKAEFRSREEYEKMSLFNVLARRASEGVKSAVRSASEMVGVPTPRF
jgi:hypothetical protein